VSIQERVELLRMIKEARHGVKLGPEQLQKLYAAVPALLADVDRLTGDNAALSEALDTALAHLKESEADRDKAIAELAQVRAQLEALRQELAEALVSIEYWKDEAAFTLD
jgi:chromosome segregation ATPase